MARSRYSIYNEARTYIFPSHLRYTSSSNCKPNYARSQTAVQYGISMKSLAHCYISKRVKMSAFGSEFSFILYSLSTGPWDVDHEECIAC